MGTEGWAQLLGTECSQILEYALDNPNIIHVAQSWPIAFQQKKAFCGCLDKEQGGCGWQRRVKPLLPTPLSASSPATD